MMTTLEKLHALRLRQERQDRGLSDARQAGLWLQGFSREEALRGSRVAAARRARVMAIERQHLVAIVAQCPGIATCDLWDAFNAGRAERGAKPLTYSGFWRFVSSCPLSFTVTGLGAGTKGGKTRRWYTVDSLTPEAPSAAVAA